MTAQITEQFSARGALLPGTAELQAARGAALARFSELGLPGRASETWHYTDLAPLGRKGLDFIAPVPTATTLAAAEQALSALQLEPDAPRCVFVDGYFIASLSLLNPTAGLTIETRTGQPTGSADNTAPADSALVALNTAFAREAAMIRLASTQLVPVEFVFIGSGQGLAPQANLKIELERHAQASVVLQFLELPGAGEAWLNLVVDIEQEEGSQLTLYRLQEHGPDQFQTTLTRARLAAGASLVAGNIELGGKLVRNEYQIALAGDAAMANIYGLALTRDKQHCDMRIDVDHQAPHTTSRQEYRAIADDASRSIFNGKVSVREDAQHIDAQQRNDNLLLSSRAEIDTKPELEIYADQVICSHDATVGELSDEHLFYLQSRGIDKDSARGILTTAFANTVLERITLPSFRSRAQEAVNAHLPRRVELQ